MVKSYLVFHLDLAREKKGKYEEIILKRKNKLRYDDIRGLIRHKEVCRRDLDEKMDRGLERDFSSSGSSPNFSHGRSQVE